MIQDTRHMLEAITDSIAERIALLSLDCEVLWMNKAAQEYVRRVNNTPGIAARCCAVTRCERGPDGGCADSCPVRVYLQSGALLTTEYAYYDEEKQANLVDEVAIYPLLDERGNTAQFVYVARDLTERTRYEQSLRETADKLRKLDEMKSDFISIASHELRTPITAIKSAIDIILKEKAGGITDTQRRFLGMAERNINRLSTLISDLLSISKIESGKMELNFAEKDVRGIAEQVVMTLSALASERSIALRMQIPPGLPPLYIDPSRIEQVFINLIGNAIKFTPNGGAVTIDARLVEEPLDMPDDTTGFVEIAVSDTGCGIAREHMSRLFEKFFQAEPSLSRQKQPGSGLGLAISKGIVESHGGTIVCESELGRGSVFRFTLPVIDLDRRFHEQVRDAMAHAREHGTSLSILIFSIMEYQRLLERLGRKECERIFTFTVEMILRNGIKTKDLLQVSLHRGELFLLMPETDAAGVGIVRERIERLILPQSGAADGLGISFCSGAATFPQDAATPEDLVRHATPCIMFGASGT